MNKVEGIVLFREGDFKPNLYLDFLAQIRDYSERDDAAYDFFVATEDMFTLTRSGSDAFDFDIKLPLKDRVLGGMDDLYAWSIDDLKRAHSSNAAFAMLASVTPKNGIVTAETCIKSLQWLVLHSSGDMMYANTGEVCNRDEVTIIPFMTSLKYPNHPIYTVATNSRLLSVQGDLRSDRNSEWFITELFVEEPSNASCVDTLFYPKLDVQDGVSVGDTVFQKGIQFSFFNPFSEESVLGRCPGIVKPEDFTIESNLSWKWFDNKLGFRLPEGKVAGFIKIYLDFGDIIDYKHIHPSELPMFQFKIFHY